jgi:hypothetical protein
VILFDSSTNIARNISNALAVEFSVRDNDPCDSSGGDATDDDRGGLSNLAYFLILLHDPFDTSLIYKSSAMGRAAGFEGTYHWKLCLLVPVLHS